MPPQATYLDEVCPLSIWNSREGLSPPLFLCVMVGRYPIKAAPAPELTLCSHSRDTGSLISYQKDMAERSGIQVDSAVKRRQGPQLWTGGLSLSQQTQYACEKHTGEFSPRRVQERSMKMRIALAALIGATVGAVWVMVLSAGHTSDASLAAAWNAIMWASCPSIGAVRAAWWLVPLLNGIFYALIALLVVFVRKFLRPFAK
jgi:hypothetical protein